MEIVPLLGTVTVRVRPVFELVVSTRYTVVVTSEPERADGFAEVDGRGPNRVTVTVLTGTAVVVVMTAV